jgi:hypothetical protein
VQVIIVQFEGSKQVKSLGKLFSWSASLMIGSLLVIGVTRIIRPSAYALSSSAPLHHFWRVFHNVEIIIDLIGIFVFVVGLVLMGVVIFRYRRLRHETDPQQAGHQ